MNLISKHKNLRLKLLLLFLTVAFVFWLVLKYKFKDNDIPKPDVAKNDLEHILESGILHAVVDYNSTNYFIYRGRPMGFQFELLQLLCKQMGVKLDIKVSNDMEET